MFLLGLLICFGVICTGYVLLGEEKTKISFLDVGQGDATLISDGSVDFLIDGGPDLSVLTELGKVHPVWDRKIEVLILSHPEQDHLQGLLEVVKRYKIEVVVLPHLRKETNLYKSFLKELKAKKISVLFAQSGDLIKSNKNSFEIIAPDKKLLGLGKTSVNGSSLVLRFVTPTVSFLFPSDIEASTELYLAESGQDISADILKVPHHGSKTSSSDYFLKKVKPLLAVISVGAKNNYGHPHAEVLKRFANISIKRTDQSGTITFAESGDFFNLHCENKCLSP